MAINEETAAQLNSKTKNGSEKSVMPGARIKGESTTINVGKIVCIGRNYFDHIKELGNDVLDNPVLFIKPSTSIIHAGEQIHIPDISKDCHHEIELAVLIGKSGKNVTEAEAMDLVTGYGVAIDLTLRDVQSIQKSKGLPWEIAKGFDTSCPLSDFVPAEKVVDPHNLQMTLWVNDEMRQNGSTSLMMRRIPAIISAASQFFSLLPGDVLLTGTPAGVSQVRSGDSIKAFIEDVGELTVRVK